MPDFVTRELIDSRATSATIGERGTLRVYQVDATQDLALTANALPKLNDKLPWDTSQIVTALSADREAGSVATARCMVRYSSSGKWGGINPADPDYKGWILSFRKVIQQIPYAVKDPATFSYIGQNQTTQFITTYPIRYEQHPESREKIVRRVRIQAFDIDVMQNVIRKQTNKLHKIYGIWYLFEVGDVQEVARNVWDTTYSWEYDPGTPDVYEDRDWRIHPHLLTPSWIAHPIYYPDQLMARPPFHQVTYQPIVQTGGEPFWPLFDAVCPYDRTLPSGYLGLPGFSL